MFDETTLNVPPTEEPTEPPVPPAEDGSAAQKKGTQKGGPRKKRPVKKIKKTVSKKTKKQPEKKKGKKKKAGPAGRKDDPRVAIVELHRVRALLEEIVENYQSKLEADLHQIEEILATTGKSEDESVKVDTDRIHRMIVLCRHLDVKASKGRRKDLKRIDNLITQIHQLIQD